jgi:hypothetical protein
MVLAVAVCAVEASAPVVEGVCDVLEAQRAAPPDVDANSDAPPSLGTEASPIAGGKLLLTKRLKLIIKYHQVIPA